MRFQHAAQFDTELLMGDTVIERGSTLLPGPEPERFDPLRNWAQLCANVEDQPVTWRAIKAGEVVMDGACYPREGT
ncbi:hypothetical protein J4H86_16905 [Spiractinospora alimapuensis]|uniref:hypothetical protein n=1 Tax=Spiractinospora alimapuensis TaxID=2820884 RepID=UPI001F2E9FD5|nr:hypothetical protein [Spiractinospora alimapuensis]QVQ50572.1 hypothetical protein J4H86_16905 [Spiractinospora alimapuensis]